ncbi:MAG: hypothetical protein CMK74_06550 [Pseudomonadales bacterium]|nr:hypothetical protein [Pseudomonadales bacterium]|tara:strand:- start:609 stop:833 length:225 start_codon:yes stop_codon:yes gene_type:complete
MKRKGTSRPIGVARLALYAEDPSEAITPSRKMNQKALRYGNKAHSAIGKKPSLLPFIVIAVMLAWAAYKGYIPW